MLVLTRKRGQEITIGDNIRLKVLEIGERTVRIGIEAPPEVRVLRDDVGPEREGRAHG